MDISFKGQTSETSCRPNSVSPHPGGDHMVPYGTIWYNLVPYGTLWYLMVPYGTMKVHKVPDGTICSYYEHMFVLRTYVRRASKICPFPHFPSFQCSIFRLFIFPLFFKCPFFNLRFSDFSIFRLFKCPFVQISIFSNFPNC